MFFITADTWRKNGIEVLIINGIKWLNEKQREKQSCYSNLVAVTSRYPPYLRKQRQELIKDWKKQPTRVILREDLSVRSIMDCRTPSIGFKNRLGFKNQDPIMTQEQSILTKIREAFPTEEISFQHCVLGYKIDVYF